MPPRALLGGAPYGLARKTIRSFRHDAGKVVEAIRQPAMSHATMTGPRPGRDDQSQQPGVPSRRGRGLDPTSQNPVTSQEARFRAVSVLRNLNALSSSMARIKGRKSILLFSEDFSVTSDAQAELRNAVETAQRSNVSFYTIDAKGLNSTTGSQNSQSSLKQPAERSPEWP